MSTKVSDIALKSEFLEFGSSDGLEPVTYGLTVRRSTD